MWMFRFKKGAITGTLFLHEFVAGHVLVGKQFFANFFKRRPEDFEDITPEWMKNVHVNFKTILCIRMGGIGDVLMITPAIKTLKMSRPDVDCTIMTSPEIKELLVNNPYIDSVSFWISHELVTFHDQFDQIIDFTHSIEMNPEAEIRNAYDICCEWLNVEVPDICLPQIYLREEEVSNAAKFLLEKGFRTKDYIVFGLQSSSPLRSYPIESSIVLLNMLETLDLEIIVVGTEPFPYESPKVLNLIQKTSLRTLAAIVSQARLVISSDTSFAHIAGAFRVPILLLSGAFDPATRYSHFQNFYCIRTKYRCFNCFQHGVLCSKGNPPPCMTSITPKEVFHTILKILENKFPLYNFQRFEVKTRACPVCESENRVMLCRKGDFIYFKCLDCNLIYINNNNVLELLDKEYFKVYFSEEAKRNQEDLAKYIKNRFERLVPAKNREIRLLEIGSGLGYLLNYFKNNSNYIIEGIEKAPFAINFSKTNFNLQNIKLVDFEKARLKKKYVDLIIGSHVLEHFKDPINALKKIKDILKDNGIIFLQAPDGSFYKDNSFLYLNCQYPGEHKSLFDKKSLQTACNRVGLKIYDFIQNKEAKNFLVWIKHS